MMNLKRFSVLLILTLVVTLLAGCAQKTVKPLTEAVNAALISAEGLTEFPADELEMTADITEDEFTECVYLVSDDGISAREVIVLRAKDQNAAKDIAGKLEAYLSQRQKETRDYLPDEYALLEKAKVETKNNTVALIVGEQAAEETRKLMAGE